jgi:ETC complex I subunit conserved region
MVTARIYKPARTAMQSGKARTKEWVLDYEPEAPREIEPLMGWTASGDMRQQVRLRFDTAEDAIAYCERHEIAYQVFNPKPEARRIISYADNFSFKRTDPWTH